MTSPADEESNSARAPLFGNWRRAYLTVTVIFICEVACFYFLSRYFS